MDIEFAKDGPGGGLYIVQARPETVHSSKKGPTLRTFVLEGSGPVLVEGLAVGDQIAAGEARVLRDVSGIKEFRRGEVLVTEATDPDWEPVLRESAAVVTARGGRTSHAAIVARELGIPAIVGASNALTALDTGRVVTVSCADRLAACTTASFLSERDEIDPATIPKTRTHIMLNVRSRNARSSSRCCPATASGSRAWSSSSRIR